LPRRAIAALESIVRDKRLLERVKLPIVGQPFDGNNLSALVRDSQRQTTVDTPTIQQNGAGAALSMIAALLGASESQPLAQRV
jgi:hypothetical protein